MSEHRGRPGRFEWTEPFEVPGFAPRRVRLYTPWGADERTPLPVLYVLDGQNAFGDEGTLAGGWRLHEAIDGLDRRRSAVPLVVAIPQDPARREDELTPWPTDGRGGAAAGFLHWVARSLVPAISRRRAVIQGPLGTAIAGASWGGLAALHAHWSHPDVFGGALALSPSCWVGRGAIQGFVDSRPAPVISRIYLDCGRHENDGQMLADAAELAERLRRHGYTRRQLWWRPDPRGHHHEGAWRRRLPRALRFMYRKVPG